MPLIRSDRTDRRRRVMREAVAADAELVTESVRARQRRKSKALETDTENLNASKRDPGYSQAVRRACQQRLVQLIPVRRSHLMLTITGWWGLWGLLMLAHYFVHVQPIGGLHTLPIAYLAHMRSTHGVAHWLGGQLWTLTALASLMIFQLRKHKLDDYRAKYRVWGLLAIAALVSSLDVSSSGLYLLGMSIDGWARREIGYSGWALVLTTFSTMVGLLGLRICSEIKAAPVSVVFWLGGLVAWALSALIGTELMASPWGKTTTDMVVGGAWLGGILSVFLAGGIYLRHIYIEAQKRFILRNGMLAQSQLWKLPRFSRRDRAETDPMDAAADSETELDSSDDEATPASRSTRSWLPWKWRSLPDAEEETSPVKSSRQALDDDDDIQDIDDSPKSKSSQPKGQLKTAESTTSRRWLRLPRWKSDPKLGEDFSDVAAERRKRDDGFEEPLGKKQGWFSKQSTPVAQKQNDQRSVERSQPNTTPRTTAHPPKASTPDFKEVTKASRWWWKRTPKTPSVTEKSAAAQKPPAASSKEVGTAKQVKGGWFRKSSKDPTPAASGNTTVVGKKAKFRLFRFLDSLQLKPPTEGSAKSAPNAATANRSGTPSSSTVPRQEAPKANTNYSDSQSSPAIEEDDYEDDGNRSLSKAERKRLRRQQQENRRAA